MKKRMADIINKVYLNILLKDLLTVFFIALALFNFPLIDKHRALLKKGFDFIIGNKQFYFSSLLFFCAFATIFYKSVLDIVKK